MSRVLVENSQFSFPQKARKVLMPKDLPMLRALLERNGWEVKMVKGGLECSIPRQERKTLTASFTRTQLSRVNGRHSIPADRIASSASQASKIDSRPVSAQKRGHV